MTRNKNSKRNDRGPVPGPVGGGGKWTIRGGRLDRGPIGGGGVVGRVDRGAELLMMMPQGPPVGIARGPRDLRGAGRSPPRREMPRFGRPRWPPEEKRPLEFRRPVLPEGFRREVKRRREASPPRAAAQQRGPFRRWRPLGEEGSFGKGFGKKREERSEEQMSDDDYVNVEADKEARSDEENHEGRSEENEGLNDEENAGLNDDENWELKSDDHIEVKSDQSEPDGAWSEGDKEGQGSEDKQKSADQWPQDRFKKKKNKKNKKKPASAPSGLGARGAMFIGNHLRVHTPSALSQGRDRWSEERRERELRQSNADEEEDSGPKSFSVLLQLVPREYEEAQLLDMHEKVGVGLKTLQSIRECKPRDVASKTVILRYLDYNSAARAARTLHGQPVRGMVSRKGKGKVWRLVAQLRVFRGKDVILPSVYISDVPIEYTQETLEEMHAELGIPKESVVGVKFLPSQEQTGETRACITRYTDYESAQTAIRGLDGMQVRTASGLTKFLGARTARPARWMEERDDQSVQGGLGDGDDSKEEQAPEMSEELATFTWRLGLDRSTTVFLSRLPEKVQTGVINRFVPPTQKPGEPDNINLKVRAFVRNIQMQTAELETGIPLPGTVRVWHEERGFGFLTPEGGGPDIFVHRRSLTDGQVLEAGAHVTFKVEWDKDKGKYVCYECAGATPRDLDQDKLFVSGLPVAETDKFVREIFSPYGNVTLVRLLPDSGYPDRAALVRMSSVEEARRAQQALHESSPEGARARIIVRPASRKKDGDPGAYSQQALSGVPHGTEAGWGGHDAANAEKPGQGHLQGVGLVKMWHKERFFGLVVPDTGSHEVFVHRAVLTDGKLLIPGTEVNFEADWDDTRWKYVSTKCSGARPHEDPAPEPSMEVKAYAQRWGLESHHVAWLASLPASIQTKILEQFSPRFTEGSPTPEGIVQQLRAFSRSQQEKPRLGPYAFGAQPGASSEPSAELKAFGRRWEIDSATVAWLSHLPLPVQTAVTTRFKGTSSKESKEDGEPEPSEKLVVSGLAPDVEEHAVREIFGDYGFVTLCKLLPGWKYERSALVRVVDVDQARLCIEGLDQTTPEGMTRPITVRFADNRAEGACDSLVVSGLPPGEDPEEFLKGLFGQHGTVKQCTVTQEKGRPDRAAVVRMGDVEQAKLCVDEFDQQIPPGLFKPLEVRYAHDNRAKAITEALYEFVHSLRLRLEPHIALRTPKRISPHLSPFAPEAVKVTWAAASSVSAPAEAEAEGESTEPLLVPGRVQDWDDNLGVGHVCPDCGLPVVHVPRHALGDVEKLQPGASVLVEAWWDGEQEAFTAQTCLAMHLYVAGLPQDTSEAAVTELLASFGGVAHCHLLAQDRTGTLGMVENGRAALVQMSGGEEEARKAVTGLSGSFFACMASQRPVIVPPPPPETMTARPAMPPQQQQQQQQQQGYRPPWTPQHYQQQQQQVPQQPAAPSGPQMPPPRKIWPAQRWQVQPPPAAYRQQQPPPPPVMPPRAASLMPSTSSAATAALPAAFARQPPYPGSLSEEQLQQAVMEQAAGMQQASHQAYGAEGMQYAASQLMALHAAAQQAGPQAGAEQAAYQYADAQQAALHGMTAQQAAYHQMGMQQAMYQEGGPQHGMYQEAGMQDAAQEDQGEAWDWSGQGHEAEHAAMDASAAAGGGSSLLEYPGQEPAGEEQWQGEEWAEEWQQGEWPEAAVYPHYEEVSAANALK